MWKKDNKIFSNPLVYNGRKIFNPKDQQLITDHIPEIKKYSTLKIIEECIWRIING